MDNSDAVDPSDVRFELKVAGQETAYDRLRMVLEIQREGIRRLYPPRQVQSIYLDSHFGRALEENLAGVSHREKLRFRWYGTESTEVVGKLELKVRENTLGWKRIVAVDRRMRVAGADRTGFVKDLAAGVPLAWRDGLSGLEPTQWVSYRREYLTTADLAVRLTIDRQIRTWDQRPRRTLGDDPLNENRGSRIFVLELKCAPAALHVAEGIVHRLPWPVGRCSKFVFASDPTHGPVPSLEPL